MRWTFTLDLFWFRLQLNFYIQPPHIFEPVERFAFCLPTMWLSTVACKICPQGGLCREVRLYSRIFTCNPPLFLFSGLFKVNRVSRQYHSRDNASSASSVPTQVKRSLIQRNLYYRLPPHNIFLSSAVNYFRTSRKICYDFSLLTMASSSRWPVDSIPTVFVVREFDCRVHAIIKRF